jgi:hypothetical protein
MTQGVSLSILHAAAALALMCAPLPLRAEACAEGEQPKARVSALADRGAFHLEDGRILRPVGVVFSGGAARSAFEQQRNALWLGREIALAHLSPAPDRWGRHSAWGLVPSALDGQEALPLSVALLGDGLGLAEPSEVPAACRPALLRAEAEARRARRGIWREPDMALVNANAPADATKRLLGQFGVMEGRVTRTGEGRQRLFIDFGPRGSGAASAAVLRRNMAMVLPSGVKLADLKGKRVRVRGVLESQGDRPFMLLESAAMIEVLD